MTTTTTAATDYRPAVFIQLLADFRNLFGHGVWFDLSYARTTDEILGAVEQLRATSPSRNDHPERLAEAGAAWIVTGTRNLPCLTSAQALRAGRDEHALNCFLADLSDDYVAIDDPNNWWLYQSWLEFKGFGPGHARRFLDDYRGSYGSGAEFIEQLLEETGDLDRVPSRLTRHIDWDGVWGEYLAEGDWFELEHGHLTAIFAR